MVERIAKASKVPVNNTHRDLERGPDVLKMGLSWALQACYPILILKMSRDKCFYSLRT